jgi:alpha-mannosidase/mannosylglycerate hydrolase
MEWDPMAYAVLAERLGKDEGGYHFEHTHLDAYIDEMLPTAGQISTTLTGELREPALTPVNIDQQWLIPGVTSSRVNLKLANAACQDTLCQWAEPLSALATAALGKEYPQGFLDVAWRWLLQNHPHDSICGCSIDVVHQDMMYRFHQTQQIADRLALAAMRSVAAGVRGDVGEHELRVCVFNPLPVEVVEVVDLDLELPQDWPVFNQMSNQQDKIAFRIYGSDGDELAYQRLAQHTRQNRMRTFPWAFPEGYTVNVTRVSLPLRLPALGYTTLSVRPGKAGEPTRHPMKPDLAVSERALENQFLRVEVESDGTLTVTDRRGGQVYRRLLTFEDVADIGDGWNHGQAVSDAAFISAGCHTSVSLARQGRFAATLRVRTRMEVPEEFDFGAMRRSDDLRELVVDNYVTLRAFAERVEVETVVHNTVRDHRLRVLFPSGAAEAQTYLADTPFDVVERKIALRADNPIYREPEIDAKPQQSFSAVFDGQRGLAVISSGLLEAAVIDRSERPLALTLFRATRQTVGTNGEPDGQMPGELRFRYWVTPLRGEPERGQVLRLGQMLAGGFRAAQIVAKDQVFHRPEREMPAEASFLRLEGGAVLTSLRRTQAGLEARVFNPETHPLEVGFDLSGWPAGLDLPRLAQVVDLESKPVGEAQELAAGKATFTLGAKKILTVCFQ